MKGKGRDSSFQEKISHTYTLNYSIVEFLSCIKKNLFINVGSQFVAQTQKYWVISPMSSIQ